MKVICTVLVAGLMLGFSAGVRAQSSPTSSATSGSEGKSYGADVVWDGKAPAGWGGVVTDMKLLAPGVGWAERGGRLYWTSDNGANWRDITPPIEILGPVFFLDTKRGWASIARTSTYESPLPSDDIVFEVA